MNWLASAASPIEVVYGSTPGLSDEKGAPIPDAVVTHLNDEREERDLPETIVLDFEKYDALKHLNRWRDYQENGDHIIERVKETADQIRVDVGRQFKIGIYGVPWHEFWQRDEQGRLVPFAAIDSPLSAAAHELSTSFDLFFPSLYSFHPTESFPRWREELVRAPRSMIVPTLHHRYAKRGEESPPADTLVPIDRFVVDQLMPLIRAGHIEALHFWTWGDHGRYTSADGTSDWREWGKEDDRGQRDRGLAELRARGRKTVEYIKLLRQVFPR